MPPGKAVPVWGGEGQGMRSVSVAGRLAAVAAVVAAIVIVAILLFSGGSSYTVTGVFQNAAQPVKGDSVEIDGTNVGTVDDISLTPAGSARLKMSIASTHTAPRQG